MSSLYEFVRFATSILICYTTCSRALMNKTLLTISTALFSFIGTFASVVTPAHAQTFTLPVQFTYAGLTFNDPLTYAPTAKNPQTVTLSFNIPQKIQVTHQETNEVLGEVVLLPTITTAMTLSVLPDQKPPLVIKEDADEYDPTPAPSQKLTSTPTTKPETSPTTPVTPVASTTQTNTAGGGLDPEKLFAMSNAFRQSRGLPAFQKDERACSLAASRAPEIAGEVASGNMHAGLRARALPYWNSENIISMRTEESAFNWWVNDKIHHDAIVGNYTYSCVACSGNSCAQEFTNFQPK